MRVITSVSGGVCLLAAVVGWQVATPSGWGQTPPPPPTLPASPDTSAPPTANEAEVYNRGPLHEAYAAPASADPEQGPVVAQQPPEVIEEVPPEHAPEGDNVVWIPGYWAFDEELNDFLWVSGLWRDAPPGRRWVPGYWNEAEGGWRWIAGAWMEEGTDELAYLPPPPPTQERGPNGPQPAEDQFWVPGHWDYGGADYRWRPGYWAPHQSQWVWVPAQYVWTPRGCLFVPGYWDFVLGYRGVCFAPVYFPGHRWGRPWTPTVAVNVWDSLVVHLWTRPGYGRYYFGDYYGPRYAQRGFIPFYDAHRRHGYDPLYVYFRWRFGGDFDRRLAGWHQHFEAREELRPRRTVREQREFADRNRDNAAVAATNVAIDLDRLVLAEDSRVAFTSIAASQRQRVAEEARTLREFGRERARFEQPGARAEVRGDERLRITAPRAEVDPREPGADRRAPIGVPESPDRVPAEVNDRRPPVGEDRARPGPMGPRSDPPRTPRRPDRELPRLPEGIGDPTPQPRTPGANEPREPQPGRPRPGADSPPPQRPSPPSAGANAPPPERPAPRPQAPQPRPEPPDRPNPQPRGPSTDDGPPRSNPPGGPERGPKSPKGDKAEFFPPGIDPPEAPRETVPLPRPETPRTDDTPPRPIPDAPKPGPGLKRPEGSSRPGRPAGTRKRNEAEARAAAEESPSGSGES
jgi:hypothetical protein